MTENTALLIIDVQTGLIDEGAYQADDLLARVNTLASRARGAHVPVIYVQHNADDPRDSLHPDSPGHAIHPAVAPHQGELIVQKAVPDAFENTPLKQELDARSITRLIVAGMQTDYCVNATSRRAAKLGYDVTLVSDAHTTTDTNNMTAHQIIDQYNHDLGDGIVRLVTTADVQF